MSCLSFYYELNYSNEMALLEAIWPYTCQGPIRYKAHATPSAPLLSGYFC